MQRGKGERCAGFISKDGEWVYCTRPEYAGALQPRESSGGDLYRHKMHGECGCGQRHGADIPRPERAKRGAEKVAPISRVKTYDYRDEQGQVRHQTVRYEPKKFMQRRPDGEGGWSWNLNGVERVPYRLPELLTADTSELVFIVEGEKDADRLAAAGLIATTTAQGARGWGKSLDSAQLHLRGRHLVIVPDADKDGDRYRDDIIQTMQGVAASIRVVQLPRLEHGSKEDISDWLDRRGGTIEELKRLAAATPTIPQEDPEEKPQEKPAEQQKQGSSEQRGNVTSIIADAIMEHGEHFAVDAGGKLWVYQDGVYRPQGDLVVKRMVKALMLGPLDMAGKWSTHQADEVVSFISVDAPVLWERPPLDRINLLNGILDVKKRDLLPHTPEFLSPIQLPVSFDPSAKCPEIEKFVKMTFPEDAQALAWEIPAWLMTPDTSFQKAVLLIGEGGNGKSMYLSAVAEFIGKRNISALPLQKLEADRFAAARLIGKMANICADLPSEGLAGTSMFKMITGGDPIPVEYKFRDSFDILPHARLIFSANVPPRSPDSSPGFYDRWLVIPFTGRFRGTDQEVDRDTLGALLSDPHELSGLLNKALEVLPKLRKTRRFSESESTRRALAEFHATTDPFSIWLEDNTVEDAEAVTTKDELYGAYRIYCMSTNRAPGTKVAFALALKRACPDIGEKQRTIRGRLQHCWIGISLRPQHPTGGNGRYSQTSRTSRTSSHLIDFNHARGGDESDEVMEDVMRAMEYTEEQDNANSVNSVNGVNGAVEHGNAGNNGIRTTSAPSTVATAFPADLSPDQDCPKGGKHLLTLRWDGRDGLACRKCQPDLAK